MPFFALLLFLGFVIFVGVTTLRYAWKYLRTGKLVFLKKLALVWMLPAIFIGIALYAHFPITKNRIIGLYHIDNNFYPGENADWQKAHFSFEITKNNEFLFYEKLKDGSIKTTRGKINWYRRSPPMLFRIAMEKAHPLVDEYPGLYRGNRRFYYVFESKYGNMFYRKVR